VSGIRDQLRSSVAASSAPYGYTLTVWGSGAVAISQLGSPGAFQVLLLIAGAVAGFVLVEAAAYGSLSIRPASGEPTQMVLVGNAHLLSAGGAVVLVWALLHAVTTGVGWLVAGFAATVAYLVVSAAQTKLAERSAAR
jgi:hypothetical protein